MSDFNVKGTIEAFIKSEGFSKAIEQFDELAKKADETGKKFRGAADDSDKFAGKQRVSSREVRQLTAEILHQAGATSSAGEAGQFMAAALDAIESSSQLANLALAGTTLGVAVLVPLIVRWMQSSKGASEEQRKLTDAMVEQLPQLEAYSKAIGGVNEALDTQVKSARELAVIKQGERVEEINKELESLQKGASGVKVWRQEHVDAKAAAQAMAEGTAAMTHQETEEEKAARKTAAQIANLRAERERLNAAIAQGKSLGEVESDERAKADAAKKAQEDALDASFERMSKEIEYQNTLTEADSKAADEKQAYEDQQSRQADFDIIEDGRRRHKSMEVAIQLEQQKETAISALQRQAAEEDARRQAIRKAGMVAFAQAGIGLLGTLFKKQKAAAIAQAIIDTFQSANAALKNPPGPPWTIPLAAAAIVQGMQNVAQIRKQSAGFDNPMSDALAREFGYKWAGDFIRHTNTGFMAGLASQGNPMTNTYVTNNYGATINGGMHLGGFFGDNETELLKRVNRRLSDPIARLEARTRIS